MYKGYDSIGAGQEGVRGEGTLEAVTTYQIDGQIVQIDESSFIKDADFHRDGVDLVLEHESGSAVVEGYFSAETAPDLVSADGSVFSGNLVQSFLKGSGEYAQAPMINDESPVGVVQEMSGGASVTRVGGSVEEASLGTPIYEGDIIETGSDGALNIVFADDTNFAVSQDSKLSIDEYVYDPDTHEGSTDFSVLKGLFVFTSGLIGREDPDDVTIDTPQGSIGIRGTIIAGDVNTGEITVVEGAIVLRDFSGNEVTLANQFETAKFDSAAGEIHTIGELSAADVGAKFAPVSEVSGTLFSSIEDAANDQAEAPASSSSEGGEAETGEAGDVVEVSSEATNERASESAAPAQEAPAVEEAPADNTPNDGPQAEAEVEVEAEAPEQNRSDVQDEISVETEAVVEAEAREVRSEVQEVVQEAAQEVAPESAPEAQAETSSEAQVETPSHNSVNQAVESVDTALADISQKNTAIQKALTGGRNSNVAQESAAGIEAAQDAIGEILSENNTTDANAGAESFDFSPSEQNADDDTAFIDNITGGGNTGSTGSTGSGAVQSNIVFAADRAPDQYFVSAEGQIWRHDFSNEFTDTQGGGLSFALAQETITQFENMFDNGVLTQLPTIGSDGVLTLEFGTGFATQSFDLKIEVTSDVDGSSQIFDVSQGGGSRFEVLASDGMINIGDYHDDATSEVLLEGSFPALGSNAEKKTVFLNDDDTFTAFLVQGDNNEIYIGEGQEQEIILASDAEGNTVIGGTNGDNVGVLHSNNTIFTMDGNDTITLHIDDIDESNMANNLDQLTLNFGHNEDSFSQAFVDDPAENNFSGLSFGDVFDINSDDGGPFDLSEIGTIRGVERIQLSGDGNEGIDLHLNYDDVFNITDDHNVLVVSGDVDDSVILTGDEVWNQNGDVSRDGIEYNIWESSNGGETVTLLVDAAIMNVSL